MKSLMRETETLLLKQCINYAMQYQPALNRSIINHLQKQIPLVYITHDQNGESLKA